MRYYVYISDSKLEMLYEQVPAGKREEIAGELSINLGLISTKFSSEKVKNARHQKIEIVQKYLGKRVGCLDKKASYVHGKATVAWGPFGDYPEVVYFGGYSDGWHIGLVGSYSNCVGAKGVSSPAGYSLSWYLIDLLSRRKCLPPLGYRRISNFSPKEITEAACRGVVEANTCSIRPSVEIEFLARTIVYHPEAEGIPGPVYIGSPIYVSECDQ